MLPTAQTSVLALPHTPASGYGVPLETGDHALPSQCRIVPLAPTAQTSVLALPHTPQRRFVVPLETGDHAPPSQCRIVPPSPTAQTSVLALPHTLVSQFVVPLEAVDQPVPSQCRIVPPSPTVQTSVLALPHAENKWLPWGSGFDQHQPSELQIGSACAMVAAAQSSATNPTVVKGLWDIFGSPVP